MCGIAGTLELDLEAPADAGVLGAMCDAIVRRGPDDQGTYVNGPVAIGMRRLSIIDVAGGHQPLSNEDGTVWIVFNGEIFNYQPLQAELKQRGHRFATRSDTETIVHLYEEYGVDCVKHLRGMFAFAIWDTRARTLFVARDRLGIKPLHYAFDGRRFVFGSEIKSLLRHPLVSRAVDWTGIDAFFTYGYIPAPWTAYEAVKKLLPGHRAVIGSQGLKIESYWDLPFEPKWTASEAELQEEFVERFRESVRMRLMSEVPLGGFLSGGVDSSLVVAMMAQESAQPVNTFTIGFGGNVGSFLDERPYAQAVSRRYGTAHREVEVHPVLEEALDAAIDAFDEPFADDSLVPTHFLCKMAAEHVTVAMTGLGGDENFAGYERYLGFDLSGWTEGFPGRQLALAARPFVRRLREQSGGHYRINHLKRFLEAADLPPATRWQRYLAIADVSQRRALYSPDVARLIDFEATDRAGREHFERAPAEAPLDRALYQDIKMYLPDDILALTDRVGMWHSLELRVPFTDHTLMEFCARLPVSFKLRGREKKYLLKEAARAFVPESVLNHRKQGFASPMAMWLRTGLGEAMESLLSPAAIERAGVLNAPAVTERFRAHRERRELNDKQLFSMIVFQRWWARTQQ